MVAIELAQPRVIAIKDRKRNYWLTLKRIDRKMWLKYFDGIVSVSESQNGERVDSFDSSAALLELVHAALIDARGYQFDGALPEGWEKLLPLAHRRAVGGQLVNVERGVVSDDDDLILGFEDVVLNAVWGADAEGVMRKYSGLRHHFRTPSSEHQARLSRAASRSVIVGGARNGKTRWMGAQSTLAELYDELIESVEGYSVNGQPLSDRERVVAEMDTYHKVAAADALFSPAEVAEAVAAEVR